MSQIWNKYKMLIIAAGAFGVGYYVWSKNKTKKVEATEDVKKEETSKVEATK